jgi:hypothetical protein
MTESERERTMIVTNQPSRCPYCGYYLTISVMYTGQRCIDPSHWLAAGLLTSADYLAMSLIAASANVELVQRSASNDQHLTTRL